MREKKFFLILALLCTIAQGAWAQASWEEVCAMTNTTTANWTQLNAGSTTGRTLGAAGTTTYYYADTDLMFTNSNTGGSGLTIQGTVYLYLPQGVTITCTGADASGQTGAGAGIELAAGNALCLIGQGEVSATGGNAADGGDGLKGGDADWDSSNYWSGTGGTGGHGGGGAGAGIGTRGGDGGQGGAGADRVITAWKAADGGSGAAGQAGATAGAMGELYKTDSFGSLTATGGAAASQGGSAGGAGKSAFYDDIGYNYTVAGGGGGGGGGFGGAASNIGTGGPGGGGGGGGTSGNLDWSTEPGYYVVKAPGGKGGQNGDGTWTAAGAESIMNHNAIKTGQVKINASGWEDNAYNYDRYISPKAVGTGGSGGAAGSSATSDQATTINMKLPKQDELDVACQQTNTSRSQWRALPPGSYKGATIGTAGATTYYLATGDRTFTNNNAGGSGLTIQGTVYLYVPDGVTLTSTGADASGSTGAGAGIELTAGNALYLLGGGSVTATGGNAADGGNGANGGDADWDDSNYWSGTGGNGGDGGGGAGAGIGTRGGNGGAGGAGAASVVSAWSTADGGHGGDGQVGATAGSMGELCVSTSFGSVTAMGGAAASQGGIGGSGGKSVFYDGTGKNYSAAGGGGGGGGAFGGAACNIGTGGPGGGGGGGGASGNLEWSTETDSGYYVVKARGGSGGQSADGTRAASGAGSIMNHDAIKNGQVKTNNSSWADDKYKNDKWESNQVVGAGGNGGAAGIASTSGSAINMNPSITLPTQEDWDKLCSQTQTSQSQWTALPFENTVLAGATLGTAGTTTYYYATGDHLFSNFNAGGSGLTIQGTVYIYIPSGQTIFCKGANANGATGAGAGIELTEGNTLHLLGSGKVYATGGNASDGVNGSNGDDAYLVYNKYCQPGSGGKGGDGGGGAGAGIGTPGGDGGSGGTGGIAKRDATEGTNLGVAGNDGGDGSTAGPMGTLYVASGITQTVKGGKAGTAGAGGNRGKNAAEDPYYQYAASGGGGGGGGGFGGAAANVGTGGPGGGGGGGGAAGNSEYRALAQAGFYRVGAGGGSGGHNPDGYSSAPNGTSSELTASGVKSAELTGGLDDNGWFTTDEGWAEGNGMLSGGRGGNAGAACISSVSNDGLYAGVFPRISLADDADNSTTISHAEGYADVTLQDRALYKDGAWNTLCLPFSLDSFDGTPLEGATVKTLASTDFNGGTLTMNFTEDVSSIEAGKPYIVKWKYRTVDLSTLTDNYTAQDYDMLTGTLGAKVYFSISIADGATVLLQNATINGWSSYYEQQNWAGISCLGDATIIISGTNNVRGFFNMYPGIHVPVGSTLTIKGSGSLDASSNGWAAGIGGGQGIACGNIVIEGGTVNAYGGRCAAGIGGGRYATCGNITITDGVTKVNANKGPTAPHSIGAGDEGSCGTVTVGGVEGAIVDNHTYTGTGSGSVDGIANPVFDGVAISDVTANVETDYVDFVGTYSPVNIYTDKKTNLYLGADNKLYYPTATDFTVNACRAYFQLKQGLTAGEASPNPSEGGGNLVRAFVLNFFDEQSGEAERGDGEGNDNNATGIITTNSTNSDNVWYTIDGRKLNGKKPTQRGIYINNGKKVVIK